MEAESPPLTEYRPLEGPGPTAPWERPWLTPATPDEPCFEVYSLKSLFMIKILKKDRPTTGRLSAEETTEEITEETTELSSVPMFGPKAKRVFEWDCTANEFDFFWHHIREVQIKEEKMTRCVLGFPSRPLFSYQSDHLLFFHRAQIFSTLPVHRELFDVLLKEASTKIPKTWKAEHGKGAEGMSTPRKGKDMEDPHKDDLVSSAAKATYTAVEAVILTPASAAYSMGSSVTSLFGFE